MSLKKTLPAEFEAVNIKQKLCADLCLIRQMDLSYSKKIMVMCAKKASLTKY